MAKKMITNLDQVENEINDLLRIENVSKRKHGKHYDFVKNDNKKISSKKCKLKNKPSNLSISSNIGHVSDCSNSQQCIQIVSKTNHLNSSKSSIQLNSVKSAKIITKSLTKEIKRAKSHLSKISQKKIEAKAITKSLKSHYNDLMENKEMILNQINDLIEENTKLKNELNASRQLQNENKKQIYKLTEIVQEKTEKSAKTSSDCENKLNKRIQQKNNRIEALSKLNLTLGKTIEIKNSTFQQLNEEYSELEAKYQNILKENKQLTKNNRDTKKLVNQLEMELERLSENCKIQSGQMSEKEKIQNNQIQELKKKLAKIEAVKNKEIGKLQTDNEKLNLKLTEYEKCVSKCKQTEEKCRRNSEIAKANEENFMEQRREFEQLIEELTKVVNQNKITLLELSKMNKFQENLINNQSDQLLARQKQLDLAECEIETIKKRNRELENEIESSKPISEELLKNKETCICLTHELDTLRATLDKEKIKEKIIEEQSETIICIENELKHMTNELNNVKHEMCTTENEMERIKSELESKRQELRKELFEKEILNKKLVKLESEKDVITIEMENLQQLLETYNASSNLNIQEKLTISELNINNNEKNRAINVATFATQKLLETVTDYQFEIDKQKRIRYILTNLLRNKEEQLNLVKLKVTDKNLTTSLSEITHVILEDLVSDSTNKDSCTPSTMTTQYESCESTTEKQENGDLEEILRLLKN